MTEEFVWLRERKSITAGAREFWSPQERDRALQKIDQKLEMIRTNKGVELCQNQFALEEIKF